MTTLESFLQRGRKAQEAVDRIIAAHRRKPKVKSGVRWRCRICSAETMTRSINPPRKPCLARLPDGQACGNRSWISVRD